MEPPLRIAVISDVHTGHRKNDTAYILNNLRKAFPDDQKTSELDIIFIAGDFYDSLLYLDDPNAILIDVWISEFLRLCKKLDIVVRVLKGTPSHDQNQAERFMLINEIMKIQCDIKYHDILSIDYIERFKIWVLYVPDEWNDTTEKTWIQVQGLLKQNQIEKVDLAIMHGQFTYQLPDFVRAPMHSETLYQSIVDKLIFIGHVHKFSTYERIIAQGSFDRLAHGEEEPKGHVRAVIYHRDHYEVQFIENKDARIFTTILLPELDISETLKYIQDKTQTLPIDSFVRIKCSDQHPILQSMGVLAQYRPDLHWSKLVISADALSQTIDQSIFETSHYVPILINSENLESLMREQLSLKSIPVHIFKQCEELITQLKPKS